MKLLALSVRILVVVLCPLLSAVAFGQCSAPANPIVAENCLSGSPQSEWDISGNWSEPSSGDPTIQGFSDNISVDAGQTINFKINTDAAAYTIDIYRMGYYGGSGARRVTSISPSATLPQTQPACVTDAITQLYDCGIWAVSASWAVPAGATSGIYFAHLIRSDTGGDSHIVFVVRNDASSSAILFQTADETWQAYNGYGGYSIYGPTDVFDLTNRAYKVSYNRPSVTRDFSDESLSWVFGVEYPMVRFLEANGYDVTYFTSVDAATSGSLILSHKLYLSVGHDEYWSGPKRTNVEAALNAGVNMAFFSGNEVFWKTRWENSIDGNNTPYRTLVCYKETLGPTSIPQANYEKDPLDPPTWTGTWRDPTGGLPDDGGQPENSLTGTIFMVNGPGTDNPGNLSIQVPAADGQMRFWRNTSLANLAAGQTAILPAGTLGYEWDEDLDNGSRPAGTFDLSSATYNLTSDLLLDQGGLYGTGTATHQMTLHRAPSGALVFGAGTIQWAWGLDSNHDNPFGFPSPTPDPDMQQATVNLFADMGVQPATLQSGLVPATASTDTTPPTSTITSPTSGTILTSAIPVTITGTAVDSGGGVVAGVEVSFDGGNTWHPAIGRANWSYTWTPTTLGSITLESRATDDSANIQTSPATAGVTVNPPDCPCSEFGSSPPPSQVDSGDPSAVELGVRFYADYDGYITGIRFYKASTNSGTHVGNLWTNAGTLLATAIFTNETSSGWQQVNFSQPVAITAGTTYVASYFAPFGHYSDSASYFATSGTDAPPLHFPENGVDGLNGIYTYSSSTTFPTSNYQASNYWVDVAYVPTSSMPGAPPALLLNPPTSLNFTAFLGNGNPPAQSVTVYNEGTQTLNWTASSNESWLSASPSSGTTPSSPSSVSISVDASGLAIGTYTGTITISSSGATNPPQTIPVSLTVANLLISTNFANSSLDGWAFSPLGLSSNWSFANSALQFNGGGETQVYAGNSAWTDYSVNVAFKLATLVDYPGGIRGRVNPATGGGYAAWLYPSEGVIKLWRCAAWDIDNELTLLGQGGPVTYDTTNFHNLQLSFQGSQIQVLYDGTTVITTTDAVSPNGLVALDPSDQLISFSTVQATSANSYTGSITPATNSLTFSANYQTNPSPQTVQLNGSGGGSLAWTATAASDVSWLSVSPTYGTTSSNLQVSVASSTLAPGNYSGTITVVSLGAVNSPATIAVNLAVVGSGASQGVITSPTPGSTLIGSTVTFNWAAGAGATAYWLDIGSVPEGNTIYQSGNLGTAQTTTVNTLPTDGSTVYVTLWSLVGGQWLYNEYTYAAFNPSATGGVLTTPPPGGLLPSGNTVAFTWNAGASASAYWLDIGSVPEGNTIYQSGNLGTALTTTVNTLPTDGSTVYVTLYSLIGSQWSFNEYTYTASLLSEGTAAILTPAPYSTLSSNAATFTWSAGGELNGGAGGATATAYWLDIGSVPGGNTIYQSGNLGGGPSATVNTLPTDGSTVYVTLWSLVGGQWLSNEYKYTAFSAGHGTGAMQTPAPYSTLGGYSTTFTWTPGANATAYWLDIGSVPGGNTIYQSGNLGDVLTTTVNSLPADGSTIYVTLYSLVNNQWLSNSYSYVSGLIQPAFLPKQPLTGAVVFALARDHSMRGNGVAASDTPNGFVMFPFRTIMTPVDHIIIDANNPASGGVLSGSLEAPPVVSGGVQKGTDSGPSPYPVRRGSRVEVIND
jgi:hypothetical protein